MLKAYTYLRTSSDDGKQKMGLPVQREACAALASKKALQIVQEFADDGVTGTIPMHMRPAGKLLMAALLGNGVRVVLCYDTKRIGRTQPAFWSFAGMCRDNGIALLDANGTDLLGSVMGGVNAMLAEMDRDATVARLKAGKEIAKAQGRRVDGRYAFGEHPETKYDGEREVVEKIWQMWNDDGRSANAIAKILTAEGHKTRTGKYFRAQQVVRILDRRKEQEQCHSTEAQST